MAKAEPQTGDKRSAEASPEQEVNAGEPAQKKQNVYAAARKSLGSAFGTRKAQNIQRTRESNVIDTTHLGGVMSHLVARVNAEAESVPSKESIQAKQDALRPVPPYNLAADAVEDVYPLTSLILPAESEAMKQVISVLKKSTEETSRTSLLPYRRSRYVNSRLQRTFDVPEGEKVDSKRLRLIYMASLLMGLYHNKRWASDKEKLSEKLNGPPPALLESIVARFTQNGSIDNRGSDRLLTHLFALALFLDYFSTELKTLQEDLSLRPPQIATLFKEMGCTVAPITETQRLVSGLTKSEARSVKRAVLKTPLTFPAPKRGGPVKR
ncbi:RNA polymerase I associated factor, A49-like protein [Protomyces lactucae-debilis]|uniref:RNA polymerase I associated factor, A49-like protein n=1 Tax=Protomyces lactucae-debilis TaxID=2754530 RepID=A0A1Y2FYZ3_PROLT|nr:RNA polymerase I associated factor, A49-like protein [Protomyces lactucae-debilis]ORY87875.1 RNA polymerase I associated factor, A49-like protein [Protomyces lactucae-debilis]